MTWRDAGCCEKMKGVGKRCRVTWRDAGCWEEMQGVGKISRVL